MMGRGISIAGPEYVGYPVCPKTVILALDVHPSDFTTLADVPDAQSCTGK